MCSFALQATAPEGWIVAGSKPHEYDCDIDPSAVHDGLPGTYLRSKAGVTTTGVGTLMQDFDSSQYEGKRIRFNANVKSDGVTNQGGLWIRVDHSQSSDPNNRTVQFNSMQKRAIKGTTDYEVVQDVPEVSTGT